MVRQMQWVSSSCATLLLMLLLSMTATNTDASGASLQPVTTGAEVDQAWTDYKNSMITPLNAGGAGRLRVIRPEADPPFDTVSEGQAYGLLLAAIFDDQATFDGLWKFALLHINSNGLMKFLIDPAGTAIDSGAASDADFDMALAFIYACQRVNDNEWPASPNNYDYCQIATNLINAIWDEEIDRPGVDPSNLGGLDNNQGWEVIPGDLFELQTNYPNEGLTNLSYFSPAYFRLFAQFTGNNDWLDVVDRGYEIAELSQTAIAGNCTGFVPNWSKYNGEAQTPTFTYNNPELWGFDAVRYAWRVALDRYWFDSAASITALDRIGSFYATVGMADVKSEYSLDGTFDLLTADYTNGFFLGNIAPAIWAAETLTPVTCGQADGLMVRANAQQAYNRLNNQGLENYYSDSWRVLGMALMAGRFYNPLASVPPVSDPGDCNADSLIDSGDLSAINLELSNPGSFTATGCDANESGSVDGADRTCIRQKIFDPSATC